jgi:ectoine hydroxylase-related dioxygenase (phytanoyl-CoA dioxygenase family)
MDNNNNNMLKNVSNKIKYLQLNEYLPSIEDTLFYQKNGFLITPKLIDDDSLSIIKENFNEIFKGKYETGISPLNRKIDAENNTGVIKLTNCMWTNSTISKVMLNLNIGKIASILSKFETIRYWRDHMWFKKPCSGVKGVVGWHQDYHYWQCAKQNNFITAWIALEDATVENGCVEYIPQSQKWGYLGEGDLYNQNLAELQYKIEGISNNKLNPVPAVMKAGSISFHNGLTIHGSRENLSPIARIGMSVHYFGDSMEYQENHGIKHFSNIDLFSGTNGEVFRGPFFPIVYSSKPKFNPWEF